MSEKPVALNPAETEITTPTIVKDSFDEAQGVFPWLGQDEENPKLLSVKALRRFPILGAAGLTGSALTVVLSFLVLFFFENTQVITEEYHRHLPKPAAWLSIILSLNSIFVHVAVSQGRAVTWWFTASKQQTTVADLHHVWASGASIINAVTQWRAFNYVALATVMVATLPANGVLLQNAITTNRVYHNNTDATTTFKIVNALPYGTSADLNEDGTISTYRPAWQAVMPLVIGNANGFYESNPGSSDCKGECRANLSGIGFNSVCDFQGISYDIPPKNGSNAVNNTVFSTSISWDTSDPYTMDVYASWKNDSACVGFAEVHHCKLTMGTVTYPVYVNWNENFNTHLGKYQWFLDDNITYPDEGYTFQNDKDFKAYEQVPTEFNTGNTTFGGITQALGAYFDSKIVIESTENSSHLQSEGFYAKQILPDSNPENFCNLTFFKFGNYKTPVDFLLTEIRSTLFFTSVWAGEKWEGETDHIFTEIRKGWQPPDPYPQTIAKSFEEIGRNEYKVVWYWWGAHVAVTLLVILFILPTFYGFWTLARKTTLSPFETARAFQAPILCDQPTYLTTPDLLKAVGQRNLHPDLDTMEVDYAGEKDG